MPIRHKISISDIKKSKYFIPNDELISYTRKQFNMSWFNLESTLYNNIDFKPNDINIKESKITTSKNIKLSLTKVQRQILLKWFESARLVYNFTVYYFRHHKVCSFFTARKEIKKILPDYINLFNQKYYVPCLIIDNAIHDVCKAYTSIIALLKKGEITHFKLRYKKYTKDKQSIVLEKTTFNKTINCFYPTNFKSNMLDFRFNKMKKGLDNFTGKFKEFYTKSYNDLLQKAKKSINLNINTSSSILQDYIKCDTRLSYNKLNNTFILHVPEEKIIESKIKKNSICAIDPGNKTFLTVYSPEGETHKIYSRDNKLKFNLINKIKKRKELHEYLNSKFKDKLINITNQEYVKSKRKLKKYYKRLTLRIQNMIKELHYKTANYLCRNYSTILLGKLSIQNITAKKGKLCTNEKLFSYAISHDKFRTILKQIALKHGSTVHIVCEGNTSKTCGACGFVKEIKNKRIYTCEKCNVTLDRDVNGARNILIKHKKLI